MDDGIDISDIVGELRRPVGALSLVESRPGRPRPIHHPPRDEIVVAANGPELDGRGAALAAGDLGRVLSHVGALVAGPARGLRGRGDLDLVVRDGRGGRGGPAGRAGLRGHDRCGGRGGPAGRAGLVVRDKCGGRSGPAVGGLHGGHEAIASGLRAAAEAPAAAWGRAEIVAASERLPASAGKQVRQGSHRGADSNGTWKEAELCS